VLGVGTPIWTLNDKLNPHYGGWSLTYTGVPPGSKDPFPCDFNPKIGSTDPRSITFNFTCDETLNPNVRVVCCAWAFCVCMCSCAGAGLPPTSHAHTSTFAFRGVFLPHFDTSRVGAWTCHTAARSLAWQEIRVENVYEYSKCQYQMDVRAQAVCGCAPDCTRKMCGSDGCGGFCSGASLAGACPYGQICMPDQTCCRPDCSHRDCGDDGCGTPCGQCGSDEICSSSQVCVSAAPYVPEAAIAYVSSGGALAGSFFGGIFAAVGMGGLFFFYYRGGRERFVSYLRKHQDGGAGTGTGAGSSLVGNGSAANGGKPLAGGSGSASAGSGFSSGARSYGGYGTT
jgi:hypothetical protein